jgi:hypothetical protein
LFSAVLHRQAIFEQQRLAVSDGGEICELMIDGIMGRFGLGRSPGCRADKFIVGRRPALHRAPGINP